ncbi:TPA: Ltp family lipoprotein, partial [Enterococcus faecium]|nr:Ltp family lipoprotein [Enterococcus faecium]
MGKKKVTGEDGKTYVMKEKKPFYKRVWFWILVVLVVFIVGGALSGGDDNTVKSQTESSTSENISDTEYSSLSESQYSSTSTSVTLEESSNPSISSDSSVTLEESSNPSISSDSSVEPSTSNDVSLESSNALQAAKDYLDYSAFSQQGLYDQLIYEKYPADAA